MAESAFVSHHSVKTSILTEAEKPLFHTPSYAAVRPAYPAALCETILAYHRGSRSLCIDIGTEHGLVARVLSLDLHKVLATDPSPGMIQ